MPELAESPLTARQEYEICQRRGHVPHEGPLFTSPEGQEWPCKWCGTWYETVKHTEVRESLRTIPKEESE